VEFNIRDRVFLETLENQTCSPLASSSAQFSATRLYEEPEHPYRTAFQRDRDRIIHSRAFRRLKHKRQVFLTQSGDHYRTRLTHTLEVAQLARTMARALGLAEDLAEAIALGHDLGHTPFGHVGEVVLHKIMSGLDDLDGCLPAGIAAGGYKHNYQSVRVVDVIEQKYRRSGLNLTAAVREGILKHTRLRRDSIHYPDFNLTGLAYDLDNAVTLEGQLVAVCDEIAQRTHDLEDGIRAHYVTIQDIKHLPIIALVEKRMKMVDPLRCDDFLQRNLIIRGLVNLLVTDVLEETQRRVQKWLQTGQTPPFTTLLAWFGDAIHPLQEELDGFIDQYIICAAIEQHSDDRAIEVIRALFKAYYRQPRFLPAHCLQTCSPELQRSLRSPAGLDALHTDERNEFLRVICDQIAGMSDNFSENELQRIESEP
jgi:dGTPase